MSKSTSISRRTVLRGLGTTLALPWLEAMSRRAASGAAPAEERPPLRMAFLFVPNGMHMPDWTPPEEGALGRLPAILEPVQKHKEQLLLLSGLTLNGGRALGDGPGDHARCVASFLTGAHPHKTDGKAIRNGVSVDQATAEEVGHRTRFPSLELGTQPSAQGGRCDSGYSCIYTSNMSWRTPTSPMTKEINPRAVFDRLFGADVTQERQGSQSERKSILDFVAEDARALRGRLGTTDRQKLDEYLFAVRQIEKRIDQTEKLASPEAVAHDFSRPAGVPKDFGQHVRLMMDMMVLAFQTDSTRIATLMYTNAGSNRSYPEIDVDAGHHHLSHHGNDPEKQANISKINHFHATQFAYLLDRLASIDEGDQSLLENSMIMYGSGLCDGNRHNHEDLPIVVAGRGGGSLRPGRHVRYPKETPLTNLYLGMMKRMGCQREKFSDSTGELEGLA